MADKVKGARGLVLPALLNANARVAVRLGAQQFVRRALRLVQGSNVTLSLADNAAGEEAVLTVSASGGGGGGGTPASSVVSETSYGQSPVVGTSTDYARGDHSHGTPPALTPASSVVSETSYGQVSAVGTSTNYARQDHSHGTPAVPAHSALSALGWTSSGHTGSTTAVAAWNASSSTPEALQATSDETMLARRGGILQWVAIPMAAVAFSSNEVEMVEDLGASFTDTASAYSYPGTIT